MTTPLTTDPKADYRCQDTFLLRVPNEPLDFVHEVLGTLDGSRSSSESLADLHTLLARTDLRSALSIASPDLIDALDRLSVDPPDGLTAKKRKSREKQARRAASRTLRYLLRLASRPTPFGTFAGVAWAKFDAIDTPRIGFSGLAPGRVRPDFGWVLELVRLIEDDPQVRAFLPVRPNDLLHIGTSRVQLSQADTHGSGDHRTVNVRLSPPLMFALELAAKKPTHGQLAEALCARFDDEDPTVIHRFLDELWEQRFLMSDLRPALSHPRPDLDLLTSLADLPAGDMISGLRDALSELSDACTRASQSPATDEALRDIRAQQQAMTPDFTGSLLQVDAHLDLTEQAVLPKEIADEVETAVTVLTAVTRAAPAQNAHFTAYRSAFVERYGLNTVVPVLDVLDHRSGLGPPETYIHPGRSWPMPASGSIPDSDTSGYERVLTELVVDAARRGNNEAELTDEWIARLREAAPDQSARPMIPLVDVYAQIATVDDPQGYRVVLRDDSITYGGRTFGRFHDLLDEQARSDLAQLAVLNAERRPAAVNATMTYLPSSGHAANVTLVPHLHSHEVVVNTRASGSEEHRISLDELLVGATETGLYLWSRRLDSRVYVAQGHMLNILSAPDIARFLIEVSNDGYLVPQGFSWLGLEGQTRLPRLTRGRAVIRPAQWRLDVGPMLESDAPRTDAAREAVQTWRAEHDVPRWCYLVDEDNRLLLDLEHPVCVDELMEAASSGHSQVAVLQEMLPEFGTGIVRDPAGREHLTEIVVPMVNHHASPDDVTTVPDHGVLGSEVLRHPAGSRWTYLKVYADDHQQDALISHQLPELIHELSALKVMDRWFFIRYLDPRPHLRVRIRAAHDGPSVEVLGHAVSRVHQWVADGLANDVEIVSFDPEVARYGGPEVYEQVEATFTSSSDIATQLLPLLSENGGPLDSEDVAVLLLVWLYSSWGHPFDELVDVMPSGSGSDSVRERFRSNRDRLCGIVAPELFGMDEAAGRTRDAVLPLLDPESEAMRRAGDAVRVAVGAGTLRGDEPGIIGSMAHMMVNRMWSVDRERENDLYFLTHEVLRTVRGRRAADVSRST